MATAALVAMGGAVQAQGAASQQVNLTANVGGYCTIGGSATGPARSATVPTVNGKATGGALNLGADSTVICTSDARIQLTSLNAGLLNAASATSPYVNKIHYTASASYNGKTETIDTSTATAGTPTAGQLTTGGAQTNQPLVLSVNVTATPPANYLVNGAYADILTVTLTPNP